MTLRQNHERQIEKLSEQVLKESGPRGLEMFQAMVRTYMHFLLHPPETETEEWEGYRVTKFKNP